MIRHHVLLTFEDASSSQIDTAITELRGLPALIPAISSYVVERDLGLGSDTADVVILAEFEDVADYQTYASHPEHIRVIDDHLKPILADVSRAQVAS